MHYIACLEDWDLNFDFFLSLLNTVGYKNVGFKKVAREIDS